MDSYAECATAAVYAAGKYGNLNTFKTYKNM